MRRYERFEYIGGDSALSAFFNGVMRGLAPVRMFCAPTSFRKDEAIGDFQDERFAAFCRYELWMHAVVERLCEWRKLIGSYFKEFGGSWKYYAAANRLSMIRELGGEPEDYDADGKLRTDGLADAEYESYTVVSDLYYGGRDIVQDTVPDDISLLCADVMANARIDLFKGLQKAFGQAVSAYRQDDGGNMRRVSQEEHDLDQVSRQVDAEDDATRLMVVVAAVHGIIHIIRACKPFEDNEELLSLALRACEALLAMDFDALRDILGTFAESHGEP